MIEGLAFFKGTESNGVTRILGRHRLYTVKIMGKSDHAGTTPIHKGRMLSSGFGIQCSEWHR
ncbi:hypothetical protein MRBLBA21_003026 [Peribacillus frigoritolerans]|uniref:hypothetical protein n=1 Tax=Peribacillus frigoritolerans TaxID=450367 RepID=UPI00342FCF4F